MATPIPHQALLALLALLVSLGSATNVLYSGEKLTTGKSLVYKNHTLIMQRDCNLVVYENHADGATQPVWASNSQARGRRCFLALEPTGELVIYSRPNVPVWSSNVTLTPGSYAFVLQYDGTLRVYGPSKWSAGSKLSGSVTNPALTTTASWPPVTTDSVLFSGDVATIGTTIVNTGYALVLERTCNMVLNNTVTGEITWETGTSDWLHDCFVNLEASGELKLKYMGGEQLWTNGVASAYGEYVLVLRPDGVLVVYGPAIWAGQKAGLAAAVAAGYEDEKIAMVTTE